MVVLFEDIPENKAHTMELPIGNLGKPGTVLIEEGSNVRRRIRENDNWQAYVPEGTARVIIKYRLAEKLKASVS